MTFQKIEVVNVSCGLTLKAHLWSFLTGTYTQTLLHTWHVPIHVRMHASIHIHTPKHHIVSKSCVTTMILCVS